MLHPGPAENLPRASNCRTRKVEYRESGGVYRVMETSVKARDDAGYDRGIDSLEPDHMTPEQFSGMLRSFTWRNGEHRLIAAVLQDAIETFHKCAFSEKEAKKDQFSEVFRWVTDDQNHTLFAFNTICDVLDLDSDYLREGLLLWLEQHRKRPVSIGARYLGDPRRQVERMAAAG